MERGRAHPADHQEHEDENELGRDPDQAQEQCREQDAKHADQPQAELLGQRAEDRLGHRGGDPVHGHDHGQQRRVSLEALLQRRQHGAQDGGDGVVDGVHQGEEDGQAGPGEDPLASQNVWHRCRSLPRVGRVSSRPDR